ncbi:MAG: LysE family transporter [Burkholderiaceae bacterium]
MILNALATGFLLSFTLIVAIGAQNAFVLRQGLRREHVLPLAAFCAAADALLMAAGVGGMAAALAGRPLLAQGLAMAGAAFLMVYGALAFWRARKPQAMEAAGTGASHALGPVLAQAAAFTFLNPHVYLDTVVLVGSIGAQQPGVLKWWFVAGATSASVLWFFGLGYGARLLAPVFARPRAWQVLDSLIGAVMFLLAAMLVWQFFLK